MTLVAIDIDWLEEDPKTGRLAILSKTISAEKVLALLSAMIPHIGPPADAVNKQQRACFTLLRHLLNNSTLLPAETRALVEKMYGLFEKYLPDFSERQMTNRPTILELLLEKQKSYTPAFKRPATSAELEKRLDDFSDTLRRQKASSTTPAA